MPNHSHYVVASGDVDGPISAENSYLGSMTYGDSFSYSTSGQSNLSTLGKSSDVGAV